MKKWSCPKDLINSSKAFRYEGKGGQKINPSLSARAFCGKQGATADFA
jgi:hypothetical protein